MVIGTGTTNDGALRVTAGERRSRKLFHSLERIPSEPVKQGITMKRFAPLAMMPFVPVILHLTFPEAADADLDQGTVSAVLKVGAAVLVGGVFVYNHFRNKVNAFFKNLFSRSGEREGAEE